MFDGLGTLSNHEKDMLLLSSTQKSWFKKALSLTGEYPLINPHLAASLSMQQATPVTHPMCPDHLAYDARNHLCLSHDL